MIVDGTGAPCYGADFTPFGSERQFSNSCTPNYKFEGKERDTETNNDDFGARYYASWVGRWESPDWSSTPAPVPYANLTNPQTLNLYTMVSDNPETFADLDGHLGGIGGPVVGPNSFNGFCASSEDGSCQGTPTTKAQRDAMTREAVAASAEASNGRKDYAYAVKKDEFGCNSHKCNKFVHDMAKSGGAEPLVRGSDGKMRPPTAKELADPNLKIDHWIVTTTPERGDIAAFKLEGGGTAYTGHSGIVTSVDADGTVHAMAAHNDVVGPDEAFNSTATRSVVYRQYVGDQQ